MRRHYAPGAPPHELGQQIVGHIPNIRQRAVAAISGNLSARDLSATHLDCHTSANSCRLGWIKQDLAGTTARFHEPVCMNGLRQRQHLVDQYFELSFRSELEPELKIFWSVVRVADDGYPVQIKMLDVKVSENSASPYFTAIA